MQIYLIGFMGTGKSTVAKELKKLSQRRVVDTDALIEQTYQMTIADMFRELGEDTFRARESEILRKVSQGEEVIVSCGGGIVKLQENIDCMKQYGKVVWLQASPGSILSRIKEDESRPLLQGKKKEEAIQEMMKQREAFYQKAADYKVVTDGKTPAKIAKEISQILTL